MKKTLHVLFLTVCFANPSIGQKMDEFQLFGGYSYMRANVQEYFKSTPIIYSISNRYTNLNGWDVSVTENLNHWFGGTLDGSGLYGSPTLSGMSTSQHAYSLLYGPRFFHQGHTFAPFGHVLAGATHIRATVSSTGPHVSHTSFSLVPGGGLDMRIFSKGWLRLFQVEYFHTNLQGGSQSQLRVSTGIVLDLYKK
jgi:hypothetical protein